MVTPDTISQLATYLDRFTACTEDEAREVLRAVAEGRTTTIPEASDFQGEVLRSKVLAAIGTLPEGIVPEAAASTQAQEPANVTTPASPAPMSPDARQLIYRQAAGDARLHPLADALAGSDVTDAQALDLIRVAKADLPPVLRQSSIPSVEARAQGLAEFGGQHLMPQSKADRAAESWKAAFAKAGASGQAGIVIK